MTHQNGKTLYPIRPPHPERYPLKELVEHEVKQFGKWKHPQNLIVYKRYYQFKYNPDVILDIAL